LIKELFFLFIFILKNQSLRQTTFAYQESSKRNA